MSGGHPLISLIAAVAENGVIGRENALIWHIPEDLKRFKILTMGKPVIMGRKTFESIVAQLGKPLPGRANIVVSRSGFQADGAHVFQSAEDALGYAAGLDPEEIFIIGGAQIYAQTLPRADRIYLTRIHKEYEGDAFFPPLREEEWRVTSRDPHDGTPAYTFLTMDRRAP